MPRSNKRQVRREQVFDRQAAALGHFLYGTTRPVIMCPLCLRMWERRFLEEEQMLTIEDAPPRQYAGGVQRCISCGNCNNGAAGDFENRVAILNHARDTAVGAASRAPSAGPSGLWTLPTEPAVVLSLGEAVELASVHAVERQLELKSAYLIAFAILGYSYILGEGLETVRRLIQPGADLASVNVCATLSGLPLKPFVRVALTPIECVVVSHPTQHRLNDAAHVVFLPVPQSPVDFYERLRWLPPRTGWIFYGDYPHPPARRLPMRWDHNPAHPLRGTATWRGDCDCGPEAQHEHVEIRLSQPHPSAGCGLVASA
ncbi:MAG: hypothetical protein ACRD0R_08745 [Acidimicrobiales bacterium]